jgi:hypothetical protein
MPAEFGASEVPVAGTPGWSLSPASLSGRNARLVAVPCQLVWQEHQVGRSPLPACLAGTPGWLATE